MKKHLFGLFGGLGLVVLISYSCQSKAKEATADIPARVQIQEYTPQTFDSTLIATFFVKFPKFNYLKKEVVQLYRKRHYQHLWYDRQGLNEFAQLLFDKAHNMDQEGLHVQIPYEERFSSLLKKSDSVETPNLEAELFLSSLYFFYADKVYKGIDAEKSTEMGWFLPRKKLSFESKLDSLLLDPSKINTPEKGLLSQYYLLKTALLKYRTFEKNGGWDSIAIPENMKTMKLGDSSEVIPLVRKRLLTTGELKTNSESKKFDLDLMKALLQYKVHNGIGPDSILTTKNIERMNIPVSARIKTIMVNMERCRWVSPKVTQSKQYVVVNIPAFLLTYFKDGKPDLVSKVVVGKELNETVIFSGEMNQIVFSPYWNVPYSILKNEILPGIARNRNYLANHNMEWSNGRVRQKPGPKNSLGLVKFLFPNSHTIYIHDTPSKSLFNRDSRSFSHGCIRVARPRDLAIAILKDDPNWPVEKIDEAMNAGKQKAYTLKTRVPVFIGYFTAWADQDGEVSFYNDIYNRDDRLAELLLSN